MKEELQEYSHKRLNILTGDWVLVSPHRDKRPWQGQEDEEEHSTRESHDPNCYLCSGNKRANGEVNPNYDGTYVFDNDFAAIQTAGPTFSVNDSLLQASSEAGICRVVCFSPDHSLSLADMDIESIKGVIATWQAEYAQLGAKAHINHVQIFENKGAIMGCSNPHPHGQIWAQSSLPNEANKKDSSQKNHFNETGRTLLQDYVTQELTESERVIYENNVFVVVVPFWATWPFECMIIPKKPMAHIGMMTGKEVDQYADAVQRLTRCYDRLFNCPFPYSAGIHQSPTNGENNEHWHWHMSFFPPLLRSATVKKFMVGYEMLAMPQRDITPEKAASLLRTNMTNHESESEL
jgi:UDPglucose--hexose-1-phosphate uridylyltransferase